MYFIKNNEKKKFLQERVAASAAGTWVDNRYKAQLYQVWSALRWVTATSYILSSVVST
jgi:hypothetical protein